MISFYSPGSVGTTLLSEGCDRRDERGMNGDVRIVRSTEHPAARGAGGRGCRGQKGTADGERRAPPESLCWETPSALGARRRRSPGGPLRHAVRDFWIEQTRRVLTPT